MFEHGAWNRTGKLTFAGSSGSIEGAWKDGLMQGEMRLEDGYTGGWTEG